MRQSIPSKSGLFLLELMVAITLFAVSAAVCLQLFAYATLTARNADKLSQATLVARSAAACYQATDGNLVEVAAILNGATTGENLVVGYDEDWQTTGEGHTYELTLQAQGNLATILVHEVAGEDAIYTLNVAIPGGDGL